MKFYPLIDIRPSCHTLSETLERFADEQVTEIADAEVLLVGGGDGWMLDCMRTYHEHTIPFLGINCGTRWFLLNKIDIERTDLRSLDTIDMVEVRAVDVEMTHADGSQSVWFFFNDITIWWSVLDYYKLTLISEEEKHEMMGTGLVVSTPLGSTWYALNLGQPLLPLESSLWWVAGIATAPFSYSFVPANTLDIEISGRVPARIGLDGYNTTHDDVVQLRLTQSTRVVRLAFFSAHPFAEKRLLLAEEKLGR